MPIPADLLEILVCPETKQPVAPATPAVLAALNAAIRAGTVYNRAGVRVDSELAEALARRDGRVVYRVDGDVPVMLVEEAIPLP
jgi:uncharacterized protein YbaR (Trm112 family)